MNDTLQYDNNDGNFCVGNMVKFHAANAGDSIVKALRTHGMDPLTAEYAFRAIYNLCADNSNVSELGSKGACGYVVKGMQKHADSPRYEKRERRRENSTFLY